MNDTINARVVENDTPETNEKEWPIWPPNTRGEMFVVPSDFARKLERERNEAIRFKEVALKSAHIYDEAHTQAVEGWAQAERERDEARKERDNYRRAIMLSIAESSIKDVP